MGERFWVYHPVPACGGCSIHHNVRLKSPKRRIVSGSFTHTRYRTFFAMKSKRIVPGYRHHARSYRKVGLDRSRIVARQKMHRTKHCCQPLFKRGRTPNPCRYYVTLKLAFKLHFYGPGYKIQAAASPTALECAGLAAQPQDAKPNRYLACGV